MKKFLTAGLLAGGLLLSTATAASAHASHVTHVETCPEGVTQTVVTFDNDYNLAATVAYHWGSAAFSTVNLAGKTGSTNPKVSLPSHAVGTITYHVTWTDNFRQPTQGESTLTIGPLGSCQATTTTSSSTTSTTVPPTTTSSSSSTSTSTSSSSTSTSTSSTTTTAPAGTFTAEVKGVTLTRPAPEVAPAVAGPTPVGGVQTGGGGTSRTGDQVLPLALALAGIGALTIVATRLRRQAR